MNGVTKNFGIDGRKINVAYIYVEPKLNHSFDAAISENQREAPKLNFQLKNKNIRNLTCLVFETKVHIASGGLHISDRSTPPPSKFNVLIGGITSVNVYMGVE